jgi:hypothetical protein
MPRAATVWPLPARGLDKVDGRLDDAASPLWGGARLVLAWWRGFSRYETAAVTLGVAIPTVTFVLLYLLAVRTTTGQWLDGEVVGRAHVVPEEVRAAVSLVTRRMLPWGLGCLAAALGALAVLRRRWRSVVAALLTTVASGLLAVVLQSTVLERPELGGAGYAHNTLPSGHVAVTVAVWVSLLVLWPRPQPRTLMAFTPVVLVLACTGSVIGLAHRPSDVVASVLLVGAMAALACRIARVPLPTGAAPQGGSAPAAPLA